MLEYIQFAESLARRSGEVIKSNFCLGMQKQLKSDHSPVTKTDLCVNRMLLEEVGRMFPGHSVLAEEESRRTSSEYVWVCDPVDGTIPFSHGIPICTFSLALVKNGESILGIIFDPFSNRLFKGIKGQGAYINDRTIHVSMQTTLRDTVADYEMFDTAQYDISDVAEELNMKEGVKMLKLNSFIYPSALVAAGELAFTLFPHTTAHDGAAVKVLVEEAGGKVTDLFGNEQRYDQPLKGMIVSNGLVHEELVRLYKKSS